METASRPDLSLVIVSYNTRELLRQCLESIRIHAPAAETIVIDNASRDGSPEMVADAFPDVTLIPMGRNAGFAAANNAGLDVAHGEFAVLLNSDTRLEDDSLDRCVAWMRENPDVGATSPRLIGFDDRPQSCVYKWPSLKAIVRESLRIDAGTEAPVSRGWLAGTALVLRRKALDSVGGHLDDTLWMYWEDADLSARLARAGWSLVPFEGGQVRHFGGASGGGDDATRRADLQAWYVFGKHHWFAAHRGRAQAAALWTLDAIDVARKWARGTIRPNRRGERTHARVLASVLFDRLIGRTPVRPDGRARRAVS